MNRMTLVIIIAFSVLFTLLLLDISTRNKSKIELSQNNIINQQPSPATTPTTITPITKPISYQAISIQDDKNSISKLILKNSDKNEIMIRQDLYSVGGIDGKTLIKPYYYNFIFSPDNNYLLYTHGGFGGGSNTLFNIKSKQSLDLEFAADTIGFTPDSKYIYSCALGGMLQGGGIIKSITDNTNIFTSENPCSCMFEASKNIVTFSEFKEPSLSSEVVSQYVFSTKTEKLTKTK